MSGNDELQALLNECDTLLARVAELETHLAAATERAEKAERERDVLQQDRDEKLSAIRLASRACQNSDYETLRDILCRPLAWERVGNDYRDVIEESDRLRAELEAAKDAAIEEHADAERRCECAQERISGLEHDLAAAQAEIAAKDAQIAAMRTALDTMRDEILHTYGPMEVNDVLAIIDYNDPRDAASAPECRECEHE